MEIKRIYVEMPDHSDMPRKGWSERVMNWVVYGSTVDWVKKYRDQHYKNRVNLAEDDEALRHNSNLPAGVEPNKPY